MRYRKLGRTGLAVSEICLGAMTFGGDGFWKVIGALEQDAVTKLEKGAFDKGVTFIDTADVYSNGSSKEVTGKAIKDLPRDVLVIATKVFGRMGAYGGAQTPEAQRRYNNANLWGLSRKHVFDACTVHFLFWCFYSIWAQVCLYLTWKNLKEPSFFL